MRALVLLLGVVAATVVPTPLAEAAPGATVELRDLDFKPGRVVVRAGQTVRWVWRDGSNSHDVRSRGRDRFRSSRVKQSGGHRVRFRRPGRYRYVCSIHPNMRGLVKVLSRAASAG